MVFKHFLPKAKDIDLLAHLADGVILVESTGGVQFANDAACEMFETSRTELVKSNITELIEGGLDLAKQAALSRKSAVGRAKTLLEKEFFAEITAKQVEDLILVSLRDVTQNYKTVTSILVEQESSKKVNKDKNAFLVKLSNELKSPVHSIVGFSQAMVDGLGGEMSEKQEKYIKIINKNSNELFYLLEKIIELSKTESNLFEYDFQIFDAVNAIQSVIKNNEEQSSQKNLNLNFDTEELLKKAIFSDEGALKVIMQNILETAVKSTDIGSINVKLSHPELEFVSQKGLDVPETANDRSFMLITVSDTGAGLTEGDINVLFEPYSQLDRPSKKHIVKSIALASVKNLVKHLKGNIWVESEPMQGTTYSVILPIEKNN